MPDFASFDAAMQRLTADSDPHFPYVKGMIAYEWTKLSPPKIVSKPENRSYEEYIVGFLSWGAAVSGAGRSNVLVIIGGTGSGKSTTLEWCRDKAKSASRQCATKKSRCTVPAINLMLDFRELEQTEADGIKMDSFWVFVATRLADATRGIDDEASFTEDFWEWCSQRPNLVAQSHTIKKFLDENEEPIKRAVQGKSWRKHSFDDLTLLLENKRSDLFKRMGPKDLAFYNLLKLCFQLRARDGNCACPNIFIDNVDHLPPEVQRSVVNFGLLLASNFPAKTIIAIRPLTWKQAMHGQYLVECKHHFAPEAKEVIARRIRVLVQEACDTHCRSYLERTQALLEDQRLRLWEMLTATCGVSVRFALRNVHNMLQAPLIRAYLTGEHSIEELSVRDVSRAFFFGEDDSFLSHAFENLYRLRGRIKKETMLLKSRVIYYVRAIENGVSTVSSIIEHCKKFGYEHKDIKCALEELMTSSRSLLWCSAGTVIGRSQTHAEILITPIGLHYWDVLFGSLYYIEACITDSSSEVVPLESVATFDREITTQDMKEVKVFCGPVGTDAYTDLYRNIKCLSLRHFQTLELGFGRISASYRGQIPFDRRRGEYIEHLLAQVTGNDTRLTDGRE